MQSPSIPPVVGAWKLGYQKWEQVEKGGAIPGMETVQENIFSYKLAAAGMTILIVGLKKSLF